jgi:hypothetical protein
MALYILQEDKSGTDNPLALVEGVLHLAGLGIRRLYSNLFRCEV